MSVTHCRGRVEHFRGVGVGLRLAPGRVCQDLFRFFLVPFIPRLVLLLRKNSGA